MKKPDRKIEKAESTESLHGSERTRDHLIQAAEKLFARSGFDGVSVKEIAEAAGVNVSLVSYHFKGKEGLYRACLEKFGRFRLDVAQKILQPPSSLEELVVRIELFIEEMLETYAQQPSLCMMIHRECEMALPYAQDIFEETFLKVFYTLVNFLKISKDRSLLKPFVDPTIVASLIFGSLNYLSRADTLSAKFLKMTLADPKYRARVKAQVIPVFLDGILDRTNTEKDDVK